MQTADYIETKEIIFMAAGMAGDKTLSVIPRGFYISIISDAFRELNMDSFFLDGHADFVMPKDHLSINLPNDCFNVRNVYVYDGDTCNIAQSRKVWHKRNYYTTGGGYFANDKGYNARDPFYTQHSAIKEDNSLIRVKQDSNVNNTLFYNVQNGVLMLSASCKNAGSKVHIHYNSTGCDVEEAPIIPRFFKVAIEDYTIETVLRFRMANEPAMSRTWMALQQMYERRLDKEGFNGSWHKAVMRVRNMSTADKESLFEYLGRAAWATGR